MTRRMTVMAGLCTLLVLGACARPRLVAVGEAGFELLGKRTVNGRYDHDTIAVGAREGLFHQVMIDVRGSALEMYDVTITFGDGEAFSPPTRLLFGAGSESRIVDLPGAARIIRRVDFRYGNLPRGGRAKVRLLAR